MDTAVAAGSFSTLITAIKVAGLVETLKDKGSFTVFASTDAAFAKTAKADLDALLKYKTRLTVVLTYHVMAVKSMVANVKAGDAPTVNERMPKLTTFKGVMINDANLTATDIAASNSDLDLINTVLLP